MRSVRFAALATIVALIITLVPPAGQVVVHASPVTLMETLTDLPEAATARTQGSTEGSAGDAFTSATEPVSRSEVIDAPLTFNMMGFKAPEGVTAIRARTFDGEDWQPWEELELVHPEHGPDPGSAEAERAHELNGDQQLTEPWWVGEATRFQVEVQGAKVGDLTANIIDSMGSSGGPVERTYDTRPATPAYAADLQIVSRAQWGADESLRSESGPRYARRAHMGVVHHTAHSSDLVRANGYSREEAPGIVRAMYHYHTQGRGWNDIGYNVIIDRFGTIYEGRAGGFERSVIGAHAAGFNTGSFGVSIIGNFNGQQASPDAIDSLVRVLGLKSAIHGVNPTAWTDKMPGGTWRPTILGHRDVGSTSCPGMLHSLLPEIRERAVEYSYRFPDVPEQSPHRSAILTLSYDGVTTGCRQNDFCPDDGLSRAQASTFLMRAFGFSPKSGTPVFPDVGADGVHAPAINALTSRQLINGYENGTFGPWDELTRGQLASLLARTLQLQLQPPVTNPYPDVAVDNAHAPALAALREVGIVGDCGSGNFCPHEVVERDSTASFVQMAREFYAEREAERRAQEEAERRAREEAEREAAENEEEDCLLPDDPNAPLPDCAYA